MHATNMLTILGQHKVLKGHVQPQSNPTIPLLLSWGWFQAHKRVWVPGGVKAYQRQDRCRMLAAGSITRASTYQSHLRPSKTRWTPIKTYIVKTHMRPHYIHVQLISPSHMGGNEGVTHVWAWLPAIHRQLQQHYTTFCMHNHNEKEANIYVHNIGRGTIIHKR
jgi:hypothetical protein